MRIRRRDDRGATLIGVLIVVSVIAIVVGAIMSLAASSMRTTMALRDQAAQSSSADGAAEIAINTLLKGPYTGTGNCFTGSSTLPLPGFYKSGNNETYSAVVTCAPDVANGEQFLSSKNTLVHALLTKSTSSSEDGIYVKLQGKD